MRGMSNETELGRLYDVHAGALAGYLLNLTRNEADTHDLLQEVFWRLARRPDVVAAARDERAFLLSMAHNALVDYVRRREARQHRDAAQVNESVALFAPAQDPDESAFRGELESALAELPVEQRAVVHLKLWESLTFDAIAEMLHIPLNTAASRYRYGLDKLRTRLRPLYDEIK